MKAGWSSPYWEETTGNTLLNPWNSDKAHSRDRRDLQSLNSTHDSRGAESFEPLSRTGKVNTATPCQCARGHLVKMNLSPNGILPLILSQNRLWRMSFAVVLHDLSKG